MEGAESVSLASEFKALGQQNLRAGIAKAHRTQAAKADALALRVRLLLDAGATRQEVREVLGISLRTVVRAVKRKERKEK